MQTEFIEPDLNAAAFLLSRGHKLLGLEPSGRNRFNFRFQDTGSAEHDQRSFYAGAMVSALDYSTNLRLLKDRLYAFKKLTAKEHESTQRIGDGNGKSRHATRQE